MKQRIICKTLAVAVIILFIGCTIQPSVAVQPDKINLIPDNIEKKKLTESINEILENYRPTPFVSNLFNRASGTSFLFGMWFIWKLFLASMWILNYLANWNNWP